MIFASRHWSATRCAYSAGTPASVTTATPAVEAGKLVQIFQCAVFQDDVIAALTQIHGELGADKSTHFVYTPNSRTVRQVWSSSRSSAAVSSAEGSPHQLDVKIIIKGDMGQRTALDGLHVVAEAADDLDDLGQLAGFVVQREQQREAVAHGGLFAAEDDEAGGVVAVGC